MEFTALRVSALTGEVANKLEARLNDLTGIEQVVIILEIQELHIVFDENQLDFRSLVQEMTKAGCSLRNIGAVLLL
jgi:hypothetical protein